MRGLDTNVAAHGTAVALTVTPTLDGTPVDVDYRAYYPPTYAPCIAVEATKGTRRRLELPAAGYRARQCMACGVAVWVAPRVLQLARQLPKIMVTCQKCAIDGLTLPDE